MFDFVVQRPYLQFALALACGTALGAQYPPPPALLREDWWLWLLMSCAIAGLWWEWRASGGIRALAPGFALLILAGFLNASLAVNQPLTQPLRAYVTGLASPGDAAPMQRISGRIASLPKYQNGHLRFMLRTDKLRPWVAIPHDESANEGAAARKQVDFPDWVRAEGLCYVFVKCDPPPELEPGDRLQLSATLEEVLPPRNLGQFDYRAYLMQRGTVLTAYAPSAYSIKLSPVRRSQLWIWLAGLRSRLTGELQRHLPSSQAELAISTVYGDKITDVSDQLSERFRRAGLSHILVASGTQVSLLITLLLALGWRSQRRALVVLRIIATLLVVLVYAALAGLETSIVRALVMGGVVLATRLMRRDSDGLSSLAQAALILLLLSPLQLFSAGFQLSFAATFGLIYLNGITLPLVSGLRQAVAGLPALPQPGWRGWFAAWPERLRSSLPAWRANLLAALSTTVGAQVFVIPVLACQFHQLSVWGLFSNAIAVPLSFLLLVTGALLSFGLGQLPIVGTLLAWTVELLCRGLDGWAAFFANLPGSDLAIPGLPGWQLACAYGLLFGLGEWWKLHRQAGAQTGLPRDQFDRATQSLAWASLVCLLAILAGQLYWLLVPRPELAALALPGSSAYLWVARNGAAWLLVSPKGLTRNKNADTLESALRARGINHLRGLVWLGNLPAADPLTALRGKRYSLDDLPPVEAGGQAIGWLQGGGEPFAAVLAVGKGRYTVTWDVEAMAANAAGDGSKTGEMVFCTAPMGLKKMSPALGLLVQGRLVVLINPQSADLGAQEAKVVASGNLVVSGNEVRLRTGVNGAVRIISKLD